MSKKKPVEPPKWLRNVEAIAAALGVRLYDQRPKRLSQLTALRSLTEAAGFPARDKAKGYWPRAAVMDWLQANVLLAPNKRTFTIAAPSAPRAKAHFLTPKISDSPQQRKAENQQISTDNQQPALPVQAHPAADGELFDTETPAQKMARRLDLLEDKYFYPEKYPESKIAKFEIDELKRERPWLWQKSEGGAGGENEIIATSVRAVANWIRNNFSGVVCDHMSISRWTRGEYLPPGCKENFPPADEGNRYKATPIRAWVEKYLVKPVVGQNLPMLVDPRQRKEEVELAMAEMELQQMQRAVSDKHMETATVLGFVGGFAHWLGLQQDKFIEDRGGVRKVVAEVVAFLNLTPEQLVALDVKLAALLAAANSAMKTATAHRVTELVNDLVQKRVEQIQQEKAGEI